MSSIPLVGIIMGPVTDWETMKDDQDTLHCFDIAGDFRQMEHKVAAMNDGLKGKK
jgi:phosphoribosylcarboxyaminoimidazole (NCAIR) mutase